MDGLAETTSLTCLNGVEGLGPLFRGGQAEVDLRSKDVGGKEAAVAVSRLLRRSGATMTRLDLRCGSLAASSEYAKKRFEFAVVILTEAQGDLGTAVFDYA